VVADPNGLFLCGDTCQTIARGIGFRFTDVKQLFYGAQRQAEAAGRAARGWEGGPGVQMPRVVPLEINYRTHRWVESGGWTVLWVGGRTWPCQRCGWAGREC
jgi:hypothetical protein